MHSSGVLFIGGFAKEHIYSCIQQIGRVIAIVEINNYCVEIKP